jgi:sialate O-acetylesterase
MQRGKKEIKMKQFVFAGVLVMSLGSGMSARADVTLSKIFTDHAVLQRDMAMPVWGTAEPGEKVTVKLGVAQAATEADARSNWSVRLPAQKLNATGQDLVVSGKNTITVKDVLVGDVWLCGGQSNMELPLKDCDSKADIPTADYPTLRRIRVVGPWQRGRPTVAEKPQWEPCTPANAGNFNGTGFYFARRLQKETGVPIGLLDTSIGGSPIEMWIPAEGYALESAVADLPASKNGKEHTSDYYNSMIKPVVPFGIKGAIWYQGEANAHNGRLYDYKMRALIQGWRKVWNQPPAPGSGVPWGEFPFYFVQLPPWDNTANPAGTGERSQAGLQIAQMRSLQMQIPNTGMASTYDIGHGGLHPYNKFDIGERLALWALRNEYGRTNLVVSGPIYKALKIEGNKIRIFFDHAGSGLMVGRKSGREPTVEVKNATPGRFAIAGDDQKWVWADAVVDPATNSGLAADTVVVSNTNVPNPVAVRYAYGYRGNLYNKEGLPASPFCTDRWPLLQPEGKKLLLLRGWPQTWDTEFTLQAPDDTTVEGTVRGGKLVKLRVTPAARRADVVVAAPYHDPLAFEADPPSGEAPLSVRFDATQVTSDAGRIVSYEWDFGDGRTAKDMTATHTYEKAGTYPATLRAKTGNGETEIASRVISATTVDTTAPTVVAVTAPDRPGRGVVVAFSEPVRQEEAEVAANYTIEPGIKVASASLSADRTMVTLTTSPLPKLGEYSVTVKNIRDRAKRPNLLAETRKTFRYAPLFAWWKLNEGDGFVAADSSGNKFGGALMDGAIWTNEAGRVAPKFAGSFVKCETYLEGLAVPFSIAFWVNPATAQVCDVVNIFGNIGYAAGGVFGMMMQQEHKTNRYTFLYADGKKSSGPGSVRLDAGQWQHVTIVCDTEKDCCYVNGVEQASGKGLGSFAPNLSHPFCLPFNYLPNAREFHGLLSDFRIYRTALSPAEVQAVMKE